MRKSKFRWLAGLALLLLAGSALSACGSTETPAPTRAPAPTGVPLPTTQPTLPPAPTAAPSGGSSEYSHSSGAFRLSYPEGWEVEEDPTGVTITDPEIQYVIFVDFEDVGGTLDSAGMRALIDDTLQSGFAEQYENYEKLDESTQPDGSILVEIAFEMLDKQAYAGIFFEQRGTVVYKLAFMAMDASQWDSIVDTFNQVANSFEPLSLDGAGASGDVSSENWPVLSSELGEYELKYPPDWQALELDGDAFVQKDEETFMIVLMTTTLPAADPDESERLRMQEVMDALRFDDPEAQFDQPSGIPIGGEEGLYIDFVYTDPDSGLSNSGTAITVVHNGRGYQFLIFTLSEDFEQNAPFFVEMIVSFQFTR
ncbi:MAG: hypothetical protein JXA37_10715 [Chloroflexia bacterium]|nr:hypothetical protein [Chloroflexia bacterium]